VLSITPRILRNLQRANHATLEFDSGTESSLNGFKISPPDAPKPEPKTSNTDNVKADKPEEKAPAPTEAATLSWQGLSKAKVGDTVAVQLMMQSTQPVVSVPMAVKFDAQVFQVVSVTEGDFLKQGDAKTNFTSRVDPSGQILITGTRSGDTGATAPGTMANVNLKVLAASAQSAALQVLTVSPVVLGGKSINSPLPPAFVVEIEQ
jgi:general secretion pathway protein D